LYTLGDDPHPIPLSTITFLNGALHFSIESLGATYEGQIGADGSSIHGAFTLGQPTALDFRRPTPDNTWVLDPTPHKIQLVEVEKGVNLEVVDWGGTGRPLILLSGLGNTAHVFDQFALMLTHAYHVYGITRRGFGASSAPVPWNRNYTVQRLGDDVLAVIDTLKLDRPILVGHSIAGQELSYVGSQHPEKVAGLIYLEAAYGYAFYDPIHGEFPNDVINLKRNFLWLASAQGPAEQKAIELKLLNEDLPRIQSDLERELKYWEKLAAQTPASPLPDLAQAPEISRAISEGLQNFSEIHCPLLVLFAKPGSAEAETHDREEITEQATAVQAANPSARIKLLANGRHDIYRSNEAEVLSEIDAFALSLH
jgi:pimeloyl-ACP methyl ester carboxylesterase